MTLGLGLITICDKFVQFGFGKHKAKSIGEALDISLYRLIVDSVSPQYFATARLTPRVSSISF